MSPGARYERAGACSLRTPRDGFPNPLRLVLLRLLLAACVLPAFPPQGLAFDQEAIDRAACRAWSRQVTAVIQRKAATGTLEQRELALHVETMENLADRCTTAYAREACVLLQRLHDYLVNEANQP